MSATVAKFTDVTLFRFRLTRTGLQAADPTKPPSYADWEQLGDYLAWMQEALPWLVGDYVEYGETHFKERAAQVIDATGWQLDTVKQCARVARAIPPERRDQDLSWTSHRVVMDLPPAQQDSMLALAKREQLSPDELRHEVRKIKGSVTDVKCWLVVSCRDEKDREKLMRRLELEGRSCKLP